MKRSLMIAALAAAVLSSACAKAEPTAPSIPTEDHAVHVAVLSGGAIQVDGKAVDAAQLDAAITEAAKRGNAAIYYREGGDRDPTPAEEAAMRTALETIMKHGLDLSLSSKPDFSDVVDQNGQSHPRDAR